MDLLCWAGMALSNLCSPSLSKWLSCIALTGLTDVCSSGLLGVGTEPASSGYRPVSFPPNHVKGVIGGHFIPRIIITNLLHVDGTLDPALASEECTVVSEILQRWVSPLAEDRVKPGVAKQGTLTRDRASKSQPQLVTPCSASATSDLCYQNSKASWVALCPLKNNTVCLVYAFSSPQSLGLPMISFLSGRLVFAWS